MRLASFPHNAEPDGRGVLLNQRTHERAQGLFTSGDVKRPNRFPQT